MSATPASLADDRVLVIIRVFEAPRALVWKAWTDPAHALKWMGPREHPAVSWKADARVGGAWRACLRSPDGNEELWQGGVFKEIKAPELMAYTFAWDGGMETLVTIRFEDLGEKTRMHFRQTPFSSRESRDGHQGGWSSAFDRFDDLLAELRKHPH